MRLATAALFGLALMACAGETDATDNAAVTDDANTDPTDSGMEEPTPTVAGTWEGSCPAPKYGKKGSLDLRFALEEDASGAVDGFGILAVVGTTKKGKAKADERLGLFVEGTFDDATGDVSMLIDAQEVNLDFQGMVDGDMMTGDMMVEKRRSKAVRGNAGKLVFECMLDRV